MRHALHIVDADSPSQLEALRAQRAEIQTALANLGAVERRLGEAEAAEADALAAISSIGEREVEAMRAWARGGAEGDAPAMLTDERGAAARELAAASARAAAARGAVGDLAIERDALTERAAAVQTRIVEAGLAALKDEHAAAAAELDRHLAGIFELAARVDALRITLSEAGRTLQDQGNIDGARPLFTLAAHLAERGRPPVDLEPAVIIEAVEVWRRRAVELEVIT